MGKLKPRGMLPQRRFKAGEYRVVIRSDDSEVRVELIKVGRKRLEGRV